MAAPAFRPLNPVLKRALSHTGQRYGGRRIASSQGRKAYALLAETADHSGSDRFQQLCGRASLELDFGSGHPELSWRAGGRVSGPSDMGILEMGTLDILASSEIVTV